MIVVCIFIRINKYIHHNRFPYSTHPHIAAICNILDWKSGHRRTEEINRIIITASQANCFFGTPLRFVA